jgi:hypothetical protein
MPHALGSRPPLQKGPSVSMPSSRLLPWVGSIRDRLRSESRAAPPVLDGLYYVRNLVVHQGAEVLEWVFFSGAEWGEMVWGESSWGSISRHAWVWPTRDRLPTPHSQAGAAEYDSRVAGREVIDVLRQLSAALDSM